MFRKILVLLGILLLSNTITQARDLTQEYKFTNDLESRNLKGRVKKVIEKRKKNLELPETAKNNIIIREEIIFNKFGNYLSTKSKSIFSRLNETILYGYNEKNRLITMKMESEDINTNYSITQIYDSRDNIIEEHITKSNMEIIIRNKYDTSNNLIKSHSNQKNRIFTTFYNYEKDSIGRILKKSFTMDDEPDEIGNITEYKYDDKGRLSEITNIIDGSGKDRTVREFDENDKIIKVLTYQNNDLFSIEEFDKDGNLTIQYQYSFNQLTSTQKMEYVFDTNGNWIRREHYIKYAGEEDNYFLKNVNYREIEYYK